jgi:hypothetical protein
MAEFLLRTVAGSIESPIDYVLPTGSAPTLQRHIFLIVKGFR